MNDALKEFVHQNREGFDSKEPSNDAWPVIEKRLPRRLSLWHSVALWRAAAIILFAVATVAVLSTRTKGDRDDVKLRSEWVDLESFYGNLIIEKKQLVNQYQTNTGLTEDEVTQNLQKLEAMYLVLKLEMDKHPSKDVKDALILNLLVRIDLLNQQLYKLDRHADTTAANS